MEKSRSLDKALNINTVIWTAGVSALAVLLLYLTLDSGGFFIRSYIIAAFVLLFFVTAEFLLKKIPQLPGDIVKLSFVFFIFVFISSIFSIDRYLSFRELSYYLIAPLAFIVGYYLMQIKRAKTPVGYFFISLGVLASAIGIDFYHSSIGNSPRAAGLFEHPDIFAGFLILVAPAAVSLYLGSARIGPVIFGGSSSALIISALILSKSRGALIAVVAAFLIVIFALVKWEKELKRNIIRDYIIKIAALVCFIYALIFLANSNNFSNNTPSDSPKLSVHSAATGREGSISARINFWEAAVGIALKKPVLGSGPGTFKYEFPRYQKDPRFFSKDPHNLYLGIASQIGIPALVAFLVLLFFLGKHALRALSYELKTSSPDFPLYAGFLSGLVAVLLHLVVDYDFVASSIFISFFVILGAICSLEPEFGNKAGKKVILYDKILRIIFIILSFCSVAALMLFYKSESFVALGKNMDASGNHVFAIINYERAYHTMPLSSDAALKLGEGALQEGKINEAIAWGNRAISLSPQRAILYNFQGRALTAAGRYKEAESVIKNSIFYAPQAVYGYLTLGELYIGVKEYDKALAILERASNLYKDVNLDSMWHFNRDEVIEDLARIELRIGEIYIEKKDFERSIKYFDNSLKYEESFSAFFGKGYSYLKLGKIDDAIAEFKRAETLNPEYPATYQLLSECYRAKSMKKEADEYYDIFNKKSLQFNNSN